VSVGVIALRGVIHFPLVNRPRQTVHAPPRFRGGGDMGWRLVDRYFDARGEELP